MDDDPQWSENFVEKLYRTIVLAQTMLNIKTYCCTIFMRKARLETEYLFLLEAGEREKPSILYIV